MHKHLEFFQNFGTKTWIATTTRGIPIWSEIQQQLESEGNRISSCPTVGDLIVCTRYSNLNLMMSWKSTWNSHNWSAGPFNTSSRKAINKFLPESIFQCRPYCPVPTVPTILEAVWEGSCRSKKFQDFNDILIPCRMLELPGSLGTLPLRQQQLGFLTPTT